MEKEAWVRLVGLPVHLWSRYILKRIGDGYGGFLAMDEDTAFLSELRWARIRVKCHGSIFPKVTVVTVGDHNFEIQLWWKIQPRFVDARWDRSPEKAGSPMEEDEVCPCVEESARTLKACCPRGDSLTDRVKQGMA